MDYSDPCLKVTTHSRREHLPGWVIGFPGRGEFAQVGNSLRILVKRDQTERQKRVKGRVGCQDDKLRSMVAMIGLLFSLDSIH